MKAYASFCFLLLFFTATVSLRSQEGESLFKANCAACHSIGKGKLVGPDLKDVIDRHPEEWLRKWIKSSQTLVQSGDEVAVKLFHDNNDIVMPDQTISDAEIQQIVDYFKTHPGAPKKHVAQDPHAVGEHGHPLANPENHLALQEHEGTIVSSLGFAGYLSLMLGGLALVIVLVVMLTFKARSEAQHSNKGH